MGIQHKIIGVDINPQPRYPSYHNAEYSENFEFIQADAMTFPLDGFDVIHASPPCQAYSKCTKLECRDNHPKLISSIRKRLRINKKPYVIENVEGARKNLIDPLMLCGSMFGLSIQRHRYFEIYPRILFLTPQCNHKPNPVYITGTPRPKNGPRKDPPADVKRAAMEVPWMTIKNMDGAIPPAYTEYIGRAIMEVERNEEKWPRK